jgi:hypothetical protein
MRNVLTAVFAIFLFIGLSGTIFAQREGPVGMIPTPEDANNVVKKPGYSPYAGRNFPTQVYWGDTHLHTDNSLDAKGFGAQVGVEEAYRFARGEEVVSSSGVAMKLSRPLDWLVVSDHSDGMGAMKEIIKEIPICCAIRKCENGMINSMKAGRLPFRPPWTLSMLFPRGRCRRWY